MLIRTISYATMNNKIYDLITILILLSLVICNNNELFFKKK